MKRRRDYHGLGKKSYNVKKKGIKQYHFLKISRLLGRILCEEGAEIFKEEENEDFNKTGDGKNKRLCYAGHPVPGGNTVDRVV